MPEEEPSQNLPEVKIQLFEETKQEEDENVTLLSKSLRDHLHSDVLGCSELFWYSGALHSNVNPFQD